MAIEYGPVANGATAKVMGLGIGAVCPTEPLRQSFARIAKSSKIHRSLAVEILGRRLPSGQPVLREPHQVARPHSIIVVQIRQTSQIGQGHARLRRPAVGPQVDAFAVRPQFIGPARARPARIDAVARVAVDHPASVDWHPSGRPATADGSPRRARNRRRCWPCRCRPSDRSEANCGSATISPSAGGGPAAEIAADIAPEGVVGVRGTARAGRRRRALR